MCQQSPAAGGSVAVTGIRRRAGRTGLAWFVFVAAGLSTVSATAQQPADPPRMVLVPAELIRSMEASQRNVTGLLRIAFEDVAAAGDLLGRKSDLEPVLDAIAHAGRISNDLAMPSRETTEGLSVPLIGFCGEDPGTAWTRETVRFGYSAGNRIRRIVGLVESFSLGEARGAVASVRQELEAVEGVQPEAEALLARAETRLLQAARVYQAGVVGPFAESLGEGTARVKDASVVSELCRLQASESPAGDEEGQTGRRSGIETPDLDLALATRAGALSAIQASLAAMDGVVLPEGLRALDVARAFEGPVQTKSVAPVYSDFARRACIEGAVHLELGIDRSGHPRRVRVLQGLPELSESAVAAAEQWRFRPAALGGEPVAFDYRLTVNFDLDGTEARRCRRLRAGSVQTPN